MNSPRYEKYKDSGVEWLGDVPDHWDMKRLRFVAKLNPSKSETEKLDRGTEVSFLPMESVGDDGVLNLERTRPISEVEAGYTYFREDDVTIAKITPCFENGKGAIMRGLLEGVGFGTTELIVVRPMSSQTISDYLHWLFISTLFRKRGEASMYGAGGQKRVPDDFVRDFAIAFPPVPEQKTIAAFLDRETIKIDALIGKQKRLIELLKEKRQAVISHAVTKGLNSAAPMKDSGIKWLGEVPERWSVNRLRFLCRIDTGDSDTSDSIDGAEYPFFVRSDTIERIGRYTHDCEAVLTAGDGVGVGKVFHHYDGKFCAHQRVYIFRNFKEIKAKFFYHYMKALFLCVVAEGTAKSTVDSLRRPMIADFWFAVPPSSEQSSIISYVEAQAENIENLTAEAQHAITLLQERRTALISAAVTGKIDVRNSLPELVGTHQVMQLDSVKPKRHTNDNSESILFSEVANFFSLEKPLSKIIQAKAFYLVAVHNGYADGVRGFEKHAAGPHNPLMFDSCQKTSIENEWLVLRKDGHKEILRQGKKSGEQKAVFEERFGTQDANLVRTFLGKIKKLDNDDMEICATLYHCWLTRLTKGAAITDNVLLNDFRNYSNRKGKFTVGKIERALNWMKLNRLTPENRHTMRGYPYCDESAKLQSKLF